MMTRNYGGLGASTLGEEHLQVHLLNTALGGDRARCRLYRYRALREALRVLDSGRGGSQKVLGTRP